jgi:hypothetical protein
MRISFTHGPITYQEAAGQPTYLQAGPPGFISLVVAPHPFEAAIAHGPADYHVVVSETVTHAWGPLTVGVTNHLYIRIDPMTAGVTYGISLLEPVTGAIPPASPANDQHWFDTGARLMKRWNAGRASWDPVIHLFVGRVVNGSSTNIVAAAHGTTVGLAVPSTPGYILLDEVGRPIRASSSIGEFITTQTRARAQTTSGGSGVAISPGDNLIPVQAGENIPAFSAVYISADGSARLASGAPAEVNSKVPVGIVRDALYATQVGVIIQSGEVASDGWSWPTPGAALYIDSTGQLTTTRPAGLLAHRIGFVKDEHTIIVAIDAETQPPSASIVENTILFTPTAPIHVSESVTGGDRYITHSITAATSSASGAMTAAHVAQLDAATAGLVSANAAINVLTTSKSNVGHTHDMTQVDGLTVALDNLTNSLNLKADKVIGATSGHLASLTSSGNLADSGFAGTDFASAIHFHSIGDVSGLSSALAARANRAHLNQINEIFVSVDRSGPSDVPTGAALTTVLNGYVLKTGDTMSGQLNLSLAPIDPLHATNKQYVDAGLSIKAPISHVHPISGVTGLQAALDGKSDIGHTHTIADTTGLQVALDGKANVGHGHAIADITNLQFTLDGKANVGHGHAIADITNLQTALDGKAPVVHNHTLTSLIDVNTTGLNVGNTLVWDGTVWIPGSGGGGGGASAPANEIVVGTGPSISSSSVFRYFTSTNSLHVNVPTVQNESAEVILRSGDNLGGFGHSELLLTTSPSGAASNVFLKAGAGLGSADGGGITISAGNSADGGLGGTVAISAGNSPSFTGGDVFVSAGSGAIRGIINLSARDIIFELGGTEKARLSANGELMLQGNAGTNGQVLTSSGAGSPPYWADAASGPAVKSWGQLGSPTIIPRVADLILWRNFAFPVDNIQTVPDLFWPVPDGLPNTTFSAILPNLDPGSEDTGTTVLNVGDNGIYLIAIRCRVNILYADPGDEVDGFIRIACHQVASDAAENDTGNRLIGYVDIKDDFTPAQRAAGLATIGGGAQFQVDVNAVWQAGLYISTLRFIVSNFITDKPGSVGPAIVSIGDARVRITRLAPAGYPMPM